jgi:hypothetical protein
MLRQQRRTAISNRRVWPLESVKRTFTGYRGSTCVVQLWMRNFGHPLRNESMGCPTPPLPASACTVSSPFPLGFGIAIRARSQGMTATSPRPGSKNSKEELIMATKRSSRASKARKSTKNSAKRIPSVKKLDSVRPLLMSMVAECLTTQAR